MDQAGNVFISDSDNALIRFVSAADGNIYTAAGSYNTYGSFSSGIYGYTGDGGPATKAELEFPTGLSFDSSGSLYAADTSNFAIRKITSPAVPPTDVPVVQVTESQSDLNRGHHHPPGSRSQGLLLDQRDAPDDPFHCLHGAIHIAQVGGYYRLRHR